MTDVVLDADRERRLGFDEAIYAAGKTLAQLEAILADAIETDTPRLFTRLAADKLQALRPEHRSVLDYHGLSCTAMFKRHARVEDAARTAIVTGGSSDMRVSLEAARTLEYYGHASCMIADVGVAGLWRLLNRVEEIRPMDVVIVVAGMEGALPSVVGGLVPGVVIAVPTSVGYGVGEGGHAALTSALASCAPGIVTVNIDNGYGAACAALRVLGAGRAGSGGSPSPAA